MEVPGVMEHHPQEEILEVLVVEVDPREEHLLVEQEIFHHNLVSMEILEDLHLTLMVVEEVVVLLQDHQVLVVQLKILDHILPVGVVDMELNLILLEVM